MPLASAKVVRLPGLLAGSWGIEHDVETQAEHTSRKSYYLWKKKNQARAGSVISISKRVGGRSLPLEVAASKRVEKESQKRETSAEITANPELLHFSVPQKFSQAGKISQMRSD